MTLPVSRRLLRLAWILAGALLFVLAWQAFVGDVYRVSSPSMEPTIRTGEWVYVDYDTSPLERGEIVVVGRGGKLIVKRAQGVRAETLRIDPFGDLLIDGHHAPPLPSSRGLIPIFDSRHQSIEDFFVRGGASRDPWRHVGEYWELDGLEIPLGDELGRMAFHPQVRDGFRTADGSVHEGVNPVGDLVAECELQAIELCGQVRVSLIEQGDTFTFTLELGADQGRSPRAWIERRFSDEPEILVEQEASIESWLRAQIDPSGPRFRLRFANIDNHLEAGVFDEQGQSRLQLGASYLANHMHPLDREGVGLSFPPRVKLGGERCRLRLFEVRLWRDVHYTPRGTYAVDSDLELRDDQLFLLGDNSASSRDSREWGPVDRKTLVGRARYVLWPPSHWRSIEAD